VQSSELLKLAEMIKDARCRLGPLAAATSFWQAGNVAADLGDADAVAILLRVAKVDIDGDGCVQAQEYARFLDEASEMISAVQSSVLNTSIVSALLLSILLPLLVAPYASADAAVGDGTAWDDAAAYFAGPDGDAEALRRRLYAVECALLGIACICCAVGLGTSIAAYQNVSAMPGKLCAVQYLLETPHVSRALAGFWAVCLLALFVSIPMVAARASAIAFCSASAFSVLSLTFSIRTMFPAWSVQLRIFRDEARALVGEPGRVGESSSGRIVPVVTGTVEGGDAGTRAPSRGWK